MTLPKQRLMKNQKCELCNQTFATLESLKKHKTIHTIRKSEFKCSMCENRFLSQQNLQSHMITHTSEKPFQCDECSKTFNNHGSLLKHKESQHKETRFNCDNCNYKALRSYKRRLSFYTNSQFMKGWSFNVTNAITGSLGKSIYKNTERKCTHYLSTMLQLSHKDLFLINPLLSIDDWFFFTLRNWHFQSILVVLCSHALDLDIGFILTLLLFGESLDLVPNLVFRRN